MVDYILNGWENKGLWTLNNCIWDSTVWSLDSLVMGTEPNPTGSAEREFSGLYNIDWRLTIDFIKTITTPPVPEDIQVAKIMLYLKDDPIPIIFRLGYGPDPFPLTYSIIYNSIIKDQVIINDSPAPNSIFYIDKEKNIYYWTLRYPEEGEKMEFDYGAIRSPVKLELSNAISTFYTVWWDLVWRYFGNINLLSGDAIIF